MNCDDNLQEIADMVGEDPDTYTIKQCCDDYPDMCSKSIPNNDSIENRNIKINNKCEGLDEYTSYMFKDTILSGWAQGYDDCWVDSVLYIMFGSKYLYKYFPKFWISCIIPKIKMKINLQKCLVIT